MLLTNANRRARRNFVWNDWQDLLIEFNGEKCEYDKIGNPLKYRNNVLTWTSVRSLASYGDNTFKYGSDGIRIKKNDINFILDGKKILQQYKETETTKTDTITYYYDGSGIGGIAGGYISEQLGFSWEDGGRGDGGTDHKKIIVDKGFFV